MRISTAVPSLNKLFSKKQTDGIKKINRFVTSIEQLERRRDDIIRLATAEIRPLVIKILVGMYSRSGIKTRTGALLDNIMNSKIEYRPGGLHISIGGDNKSFVKSAALNYGAVFAPRRLQALKDLPTGRTVGESVRSILGEKAKRTIKKAVFRGKILSKREKIAQAAIESETLKFIKPRGFYNLPDGARRIIDDEFRKIVKRELVACGLEVK